MANTWYVSPSGGDGNQIAGTRAQPFKTFDRANQAARSGDEVVALSGTYRYKLSCDTGVSYRPDVTYGAIIDGGGTRGCVVAMGCHDVTVSGFVCQNAIGNGMYAKESHHVTFRDNIVRYNGQNGITMENGEFYTAEYNHIYENANDQARSGLTFLMLRSISGDTTFTGFRNIIRGNIAHSNGLTAKKKSDGSGFICDRFMALSDERTENGVEDYPHKTLFELNIAYGNAGAGIRSTWSANITFRNNTSYNNNLRDNGSDDVGWRSELHDMNSWDNTWENNIALAAAVDVLAFGSHRNNSRITSRGTYTGNILCNLVKASNAVGGSTGSARPQAASNAIGIDPMLKNPAAGDFSLKAGSPALKTSGRNIGAWQGDGPVEPEPAFQVTAEPVLTILGDPMGTRSDGRPIYPAGATVQFTAATFSATPSSVAYTLQWWNGSAYEDVAATITGPVAGVYSTIAPDVAKQGGLQVKVVGVKGTATATGRSDWIDIAPKPVVTETAPENTVLPVISPSGPKVGSAATCPTGTWKGTTPMTFARQWQVDGVDVPGATGASYTPVSGDKTKPLTCKVTATNSKGSAFVISAATLAVTDPVNLTLEQVTAQMLALQAEVTALRSDTNAVTSRTDAQDAAIEGIQAAFGGRLGALEEDAGGIRERLAAVERRVDDDGLAIAEILEADLNARMDDAEARLARFAVNGRLRLYPVTSAPSE